MKNPDDMSLRRSVENEVRAEREMARRKKAQDWNPATSNKDALLAQFASFEDLAKDLDRARSLRRLVDEIAASKAASAELVDNLPVLALTADSLDPLMKGSWRKSAPTLTRIPMAGKFAP